MKKIILTLISLSMYMAFYNISSATLKDSIVSLDSTMVNLSIKITPVGSCSANYMIGYGDLTEITDNPYAGQISPIENLSLFASPNDGYTFSHFLINGEKWDSGGLSFLMDFPAKDNIKDGKLEIEIVSTKDDTKDGNNNNHNTALDFHPVWGQSINTDKIDAKPKTDIVSDNNGNIYEFVSFGGSRGKYTCEIEKGDEITTKSPIALLIKYSPDGKALWTRNIKGSITRSYSMTLGNDRIYLIGTYENLLKNNRVEAQRGDAGISANGFDATGKMDDDIFVAVYDFDGNLKAISKINSSTPRIENIQTSLLNNGNLYIGGQSSGVGENPSYGSLPMKVDSWITAGFVLEIDAQDLSVKKIYYMVADDQDDILISSLAKSNDRIFFTGSTNARSIQYDGNTLNISASPNGLIYGELDLFSSKFKQLRTLAMDGYSIQGYSIASNEKGETYLSGNADSNVKVMLSDNSESTTLNGGFILKWNIDSDKPEKAYPIGTNSSDNIVKALALAKDGSRLFFAGDYSGDINAVDPITNEFGDGDSFVGSIDTETQMIDKFNAYGSTGMDEVSKLYLNSSTKKLYITGYYSGKAFSLYGIRNTKDTGARMYNYYFACFDVSNMLATYTDDITLDNKSKISVMGNKVDILENGQYFVYTIDGQVIKHGYANDGTSINLERGIYVIKINNWAGKVMITGN